MDGNRIIVTGRLTKAPELKYLDNKSALCTFQLANNIGYGEKEHTNFFFIEVWGKQAEACTKYLDKGNLVFVDGKLIARSGKTDDGGWWNKTTVQAKEVVFIQTSGKKDDSDNVKEVEEVPSEKEDVEEDDIPW